MPITIYTIGHGNRPAEEFRDLLQGVGVTCLADVRAHPGSRRHPQFSVAALTHDLASIGIRYTWNGEALGGRRRSRHESRHVALRNASFRAYADHMESAEFTAAIDALVSSARSDHIAIMCAERLPWRCHRYLIADYLVAHGIDVRHLIAPGSVREHALKDVARVANGLLIYDKSDPLELDFGR